MRVNSLIFGVLVFVSTWLLCAAAGVPTGFIVGQGQLSAGASTNGWGKELLRVFSDEIPSIPGANSKSEAEKPAEDAQNGEGGSKEESEKPTEEESEDSENTLTEEEDEYILNEYGDEYDDYYDQYDDENWNPEEGEGWEVDFEIIEEDGFEPRHS